MKISEVKELVDTFFIGMKDDRIKALLTNETLFKTLYNIVSEQVATETECLREHKYTTLESGYTGYKLPQRSDNTRKVIKLNNVSYEFTPINELYPDRMLEYDNEVMDSANHQSTVTWSSIV